MLRKTTTFLILALFLALPASAQLLPGLTSVGIKGGASFATLRGDASDSDFGYKTGFVGGVYGQAEFLPFFTPRIEALYVQKGASTEVDPDPDLPDFPDGLEGNYNVDYIEIPVLAKVNLPIVNRFFPSLYAGPYVAFPVRQDFEVEGGDQNVPDLPDDAFSTDYGLVIGTDFDVPIVSNLVTVSARYDLGLANVADDDIFGGDEDIRTGTFMVTLGVGI